MVSATVVGKMGALGSHQGTFGGALAAILHHLPLRLSDGDLRRVIGAGPRKLSFRRDLKVARLPCMRL
jgi:hypothetical protein